MAGSGIIVNRAQTTQKHSRRRGVQSTVRDRGFVINAARTTPTEAVIIYIGCFIGSKANYIWNVYNKKKNTNSIDDKLNCLCTVGLRETHRKISVTRSSSSVRAAALPRASASIRCRCNRQPSAECVDGSSLCCQSHLNAPVAWQTERCVAVRPSGGKRAP